MIEQGLSIMLLGMTIVFSFLVILIFSTKITSAIIVRFFPEKEEPVIAQKSAGAGEAEIAVAIAAAVKYSN